MGIARGIVRGTVRGTVRGVVRQVNPLGYLNYNYASDTYYVRGYGYLPFDSAHDFSRATAATRRTPSGLEELAVNVPMRDWDAARGEYLLRMQAQRTNQIEDSSGFTTWTKATGSGTLPTVTANQSIGVFGDMTADQIDFASDASTNLDRIVYQFGTGLIAEETYTYSIFLRGALGGEQVRLVQFDNTTRVKPLVLTTDLVRYDFTFTVSASPGATRNVQIQSDTDTAQVIFADGAQVESGDSPTSYIPTSGATATRSPDLCSIDLAGLGIDLSAGYTVVVEGVLDGADGGFARIFEVDNGSSDPRQTIYYNSTNTTLNAQNRDGSDYSGQSTAYTLGDRFKSAIRFQSGSMHTAINGSLIGVEESPNVIAGNVLHLASAALFALDKPASHRYASLRILPPQTNAQLEALSAL